MKGRAVALAAWVSVTLCACSEDPLAGVNVAGVRELTRAVEEQRVVDGIGGVVSAHAEDALALNYFDCGALGPNTPFDYCTLTHEAVRGYIARQLAQLGLAARHHRHDDPLLPTDNIVADLPGVSRPDEVVVLAAHYDVMYLAANDNSSGVAGVLEAARVLSSYQFDRTIRFAFFDLEEVGLVGSDRYVRAWPASDTLVAALVVDMIGYADHSSGSQEQVPGFAVPDVGNFLALIANVAAEEPAVQAFALNERLGLTELAGVIAPDSHSLVRLLFERSDHAPFWLAGLPAVFVTDTGDYRNPHYHSSGDSLSTLDRGFLLGNTRLCVAAVAAWAGGPR